MNFNEEQKYLNFFNSIPSIGTSHLLRLLKYFNTAKQAYHSNLKYYYDIGFKQKIILEIEQAKKELNPENLLKEYEKENIGIITITDPEYPLLLKQLYAPPPIIYWRGNLASLNQKFSIAVVGSRKISDYGRLACEKIIPTLINNNLVIISGLALGIDTEAHKQALKEKGQTIAVLGSGIDKKSIYPKTNYQLAEKIIANQGLIISQFPIKTPPLPFHFPIRNHLISGISLGTWVVQASAKSGSLITAYAALEQGREVFALPGSIFSPTSQGTNLLIKKGAKLVQTAEDILEELNIQVNITQKNLLSKINFNDNKELILKSLTQAKDFDTLVIETKLPPAHLNSLLMTLEMRGFIKKLETQKYIKI